MTSLSRCILVFAAALAAWMTTTPIAAAALPAAASPAPDTDYPQFRRLAKPLRVLDLLKASQHDLARNAAPLKDLTSKWHITYDAALARGIDAQGEMLTDTIMRAAFLSFSHEEIQRLSVIASGSAIERLQTVKIDALNSDSPNVDRARQWVESDEDLKAISTPDGRLIWRLMQATEGSVVLREAMRPIVHAAVVEADAASD